MVANKKIQDLNKVLDRYLESNICKETVDNLKKLVNYSEETKFKHLTVLKNFVKQKMDMTDEESIRCLTTLNNIQMFIEYGNNGGYIKEKDTKNNPIKLKELIEELVYNDIILNQSTAENSEIVQNVILKEPLNLGGKNLKDFFNLDITTGEITRRRVDD